MVHPQPQQARPPVQKIQGPFQLQVFRGVHEKGKPNITLNNLIQYFPWDCSADVLTVGSNLNRHLTFQTREYYLKRQQFNVCSSCEVGWDHQKHLTWKNHSLVRPAPVGHTRCSISALRWWSHSQICWPDGAGFDFLFGVESGGQQFQTLHSLLRLETVGNKMFTVGKKENNKHLSSGYNYRLLFPLLLFFAP